MNDYQRPHSPFEDSAIERLRRMGLTSADGSPERDAMAVFGGIFAGQFFDVFHVHHPLVYVFSDSRPRWDRKSSANSSAKAGLPLIHQTGSGRAR